MAFERHAPDDPKEEPRQEPARAERSRFGTTGSRLRAMYGELLDEPVPERLLDTIRDFRETGAPRRAEFEPARA